MGKTFLNFLPPFLSRNWRCNGACVRAKSVDLVTLLPRRNSGNSVLCMWHLNCKYVDRWCTWLFRFEKGADVAYVSKGRSAIASSPRVNARKNEREKEWKSEGPHFSSHKYYCLTYCLYYCQLYSMFFISPPLDCPIERLLLPADEKNSSVVAQVNTEMHFTHFVSVTMIEGPNWQIV